MKKLSKAIEGKQKWEGLYYYISLIEDNRVSNPDASIDGTKSILEAICKTILVDKGATHKSDQSIGNLVKQAFAQLPIFVDLSTLDQENGKKILNAFCTISNTIGSFRNKNGFFGHGKDLESEKFNYYLLDLSINAADLLASFLVICHAEDLKDRSRIHYEECKGFNKRFDDTNERHELNGIYCQPSLVLYHVDIIAYQEAFLEFESNSDAQIELLQDEEYANQSMSKLLNMGMVFDNDQLAAIMKIIVEYQHFNSDIIYQINHSGILQQIEAISEPMKTMSEAFKAIYETQTKPIEEVGKNNCGT